MSKWNRMTALLLAFALVLSCAPLGVLAAEAEPTVPETTVPETTVAETTVPETTVAETTVPETTVAETTAPETTAAPTEDPEPTVAAVLRTARIAQDPGVTGFIWNDPEEYLSEGVLSLIGVSYENQADFDTVVSMLPQSLILPDDREVAIDHWVSAAYQQDGEGSWPVSGSYVFEAVLAEDISFAAAAPAREVTVELGGAMLLPAAVSEFTVTKDGQEPAKGDYTYEDGILKLHTSGLTVSNTDPDIATAHRIELDAGVNATFEKVKIQTDAAWAVHAAGNSVITLLGENKIAVNTAESSEHPQRNGILADQALTLQKGRLVILTDATQNSFGIQCTDLTLEESILLTLSNECTGFQADGSDAILSQDGGKNYTVYGTAQRSDDLILNGNLNIPSGASLTSSGKLTVKGNLTKEGTLENNGTLVLPVKKADIPALGLTGTGAVEANGSRYDHQGNSLYPVTTSGKAQFSVPAEVPEGTVVTFTVTPNTGYDLTGVTCQAGAGEPQTLTAEADGSYTVPAEQVTGPLTITAATRPAKPAAGEGYEVDYAKEIMTVKPGYEISTAQDFKTPFVSGSQIQPEDKFFIRKAKAGEDPAGDIAEFTLPARPAAPEEGYTIDYKAETVAAKAGCSLKEQEDFAGAAVTAAVPGATFYVRQDATAQSFASPAAEVTVKDRPTMKEKQVTGTFGADTASTVTFTAQVIPGAEYALDQNNTSEGIWQAEPAFTGLLPKTTYYAKARLQATETDFASESIRTAQTLATGEKLTGSASVSLEGWTYGQTPKTPVPQSVTNGTAGVTYRYTSADGKSYSSETAPQNAGSYQVTATFPATALYEEITAKADFTIAKAKPNAPAAPTRASFTDTTITLTAVDVGGDRTAEYSMDQVHWTEELTFDHLKPNTEYTFYARIQATDNTEASDPSGALTVKTGKISLKNAKVTVTGSYTYTGTSQVPDAKNIQVMLDNLPVPADQYTVQASDNVNSGTAKVTVTAKPQGDYTGTAEGTFTIDPAEPTLKKAPQPQNHLNRGTMVPLVTAGQAENGTLVYSLSPKSPFTNQIPMADQPGTYEVWYYIVGNAPNYKNTRMNSVRVKVEDLKALTTPVADIETVTSSDKRDIEENSRDIDRILKDDTAVTPEERTALEAALARNKKLTDRLEDAKKAANTDNIRKAALLQPETVIPANQAILEAARKDIQDAKKTYGKNYTKAELLTLEQQLDKVEACLVTLMINDLPNPEGKDIEADNTAVRDPYSQALKAYKDLTTEGKKKVTEDARVKLFHLAEKLEYRITEGDMKTWYTKSQKDLTLTANGAFSRFTGVTVDGEELESKHYTAKEGSTVVTLKESYLNTLKKGKHDISINFTDGEAVGSFYVKTSVNPKTGDQFRMTLWVSLLAGSAVGITAVAILNRKKKKK